MIARASLIILIVAAGHSKKADLPVATMTLQKFPPTQGKKGIES